MVAMVRVLATVTARTPTVVAEDSVVAVVITLVIIEVVQAHSATDLAASVVTVTATVVLQARAHSHST